jgi:ElaB/YqjD/DUF883 family membrane-anchored ribosome-binding protein
VSKGKHVFVAVACAAVVCSGSALVPVGASASSGAEFTVSADQPSNDWLWVRYLATSHPCDFVRIGAQSALISSAGERAIAEFLATGFDEAVGLCRLRRDRDLEFIQWVYDTTTAESSPEVHAIAERLLAAGVPDSERDAFVRSGYEAAQERDRKHSEVVAERKRALAQRDRDFVRQLSTSDPGEQVRLSASYAVREGATDDDVVEFFAYGWNFGAQLDLAVFREKRAAENTRWLADVQRLVADAEKAEKSAAASSGEAKDRARAEVAAAWSWSRAAVQASSARSSWLDAQHYAASQADNWHMVLVTATANGGSNWTSIVEPARDSETTWQTERDTAGQQATYWDGLLRQAREGEARMQAGQ